jgi:hypothetical protein
VKDASLKTGRNLLFFLYNGWLEEGADLMELLPLADKYDIQVANSLFFLYNGWLEGADLMGLLPLADKYDIQVANSCSSFCTTVGWRREQI